MQQLLFGVTPNDPITYAAASGGAGGRVAPRYRAAGVPCSGGRSRFHAASVINMCDDYQECVATTRGAPASSPMTAAETTI